MAHENTRSRGTERGEELRTQSGELLGIFPTPEAATEHARHRSNPSLFPLPPVPTPERLRERTPPSLAPLPPVRPEERVARPLSVALEAPDGGWMNVPLVFLGQIAGLDPRRPESLRPEHVRRAKERAWALIGRGARFRTFPTLGEALEGASAASTEAPGAPPPISTRPPGGPSLAQFRPEQERGILEDYLDRLQEAEEASRETGVFPVAPSLVPPTVPPPAPTFPIRRAFPRPPAPASL